MNLLLRVIFFFLVIFQTQAATEDDFQTWLNLTVIGSFHKADKSDSLFKYWLENQERLGDSSTHFTQILLRPGLGYTLNPELTLWLGYAWIYTGRPLTQYPFEENRIWEQLLWVKKLRYFTFTSRTRMEQRFLENNSKTAYRARQLVKFAIPLSAYPQWGVVSSDELFLHKNNFIGKNSQGFDQNRFFLGMSYTFNALFTTEMGYMNQYIRRFGVPNFCANILSINFFLNLP
ncbi:DUF2490 domain-containing protein [Legionella sp.]|uniref:DUF2490 domain-containing protein n=1 Tax=Legionella sp. TaxID=459 RepID=UPI003CB12F03